MAQTPLLIACRGSVGISFIKAPPGDDSTTNFPNETSSLCREMVFSTDGSLFAWCNGKTVNIASTTPQKLLLQIDRPRTTSIQFSPKGTYLSTWEPYVAQETQQLSCNLHIWETSTGECVKSYIQKKQTNWSPGWSDDEHLCARSVSNEVHFYEDGNFEKVEKKIHMQKVLSFSLAPSFPSYHVACYVPGVKGQPSFVRLFKFPTFDGANAIVAQKSFYKADRAEFFWNSKGTALVVQAIVDVDKSGSSYYGEQNLYYLSTKGDTAKVILGKDGPVYAIQWEPDGSKFCVVYGFMPAKATIYNLKCEATFDFGTGPRNEVHYTQNGERLILCGFGNLRGHIEVWDVKNLKKISNFTAQDSTCLQWSPDGEYVLTATTSPRIRIGNGYRVWHYTGSLLREVFIHKDEEIWEIRWLPVPMEKLQIKPTTFNPVPGIQSAVAEASKQVYRPPSARGQPSKFKLHDNEPPQNAVQKDASQPMSKNQKRNLARKMKKEQEKNAEPDKSDQKTENLQEKEASKPVQSFMMSELTGDPEKDKRIKNLIRKIEQIEKLKKDKESGKKMELNQLEKINKEQELLDELERLKL